MTFGTLDPPDPQAAAAADTSPVPLTCKHFVEPVPAEESTRFVVDAIPETAKLVDVALVEVELPTIVKFPPNVDEAVTIKLPVTSRATIGVAFNPSFKLPTSLLLALPVIAIPKWPTAAVASLEKAVNPVACAEVTSEALNAFNELMAVPVMVVTSAWKPTAVVRVPLESAIFECTPIQFERVCPERTSSSTALTPSADVRVPAFKRTFPSTPIVKAWVLPAESISVLPNTPTVWAAFIMLAVPMFMTFPRIPKKVLEVSVVKLGYPTESVNMTAPPAVEALVEETERVEFCVVVPTKRPPYKKEFLETVRAEVEAELVATNIVEVAFVLVLLPVMFKFP